MKDNCDDYKKLIEKNSTYMYKIKGSKNIKMYFKLKEKRKRKFND